MAETWKSWPTWFRGFVILIGSCAATLVSLNAAWPIVEPWFAATRGWVRDHTAEENNKLKGYFEPTRQAAINVQISIKNARRAQIEDRLITLAIEVARIPANPDEVIRKQFQIRSLEQERNQIDSDIKSLMFERDH